MDQRIGESRTLVKSCRGLASSHAVEDANEPSLTAFFVKSLKLFKWSTHIPVTPSKTEDTSDPNRPHMPTTNQPSSMRMWPAAFQQLAQSQQAAEQLHRKQAEEFLEFLKSVKITLASSSKQV